MLKRFLAGSLAALSLAAFAGCGSTAASGREIAVEMTNFKLSPATVEVKAGESVTFVLNNKSDLDHEFESDEAKVEEVVVPPGKSRKVDWKAPATPGEYEFECDMAGHEGMVMTVTVVAAK